jgi:hypothetical protein
MNFLQFSENETKAPSERGESSKSPDRNVYWCSFKTTLCTLTLFSGLQINHDQTTGHISKNKKAISF